MNTKWHEKVMFWTLQLHSLTFENLILLLHRILQNSFATRQDILFGLDLYKSKRCELTYFGVRRHVSHLTGAIKSSFTIFHSDRNSLFGYDRLGLCQSFGYDRLDLCQSVGHLSRQLHQRILCQLCDLCQCNIHHCDRMMPAM